MPLSPISTLIVPVLGNASVLTASLTPSSGSAATLYTITGPTSTNPGTPITLVVALDHPGNVTITLSATAGTLSPPTLTFAGNSGPLDVLFTPPNATVTVDITATSSPHLIDPATFHVAVSTVQPPASTYTISARPFGYLGVDQTIAVELDHPGTTVVTLTATHGVLNGSTSPATLSFSSQTGPLTASFRPTVNGSATITGGNSTSLHDPSVFTIVVDTAPVSSGGGGGGGGGGQSFPSVGRRTTGALRGEMLPPQPAPTPPRRRKTPPSPKANPWRTGPVPPPKKGPKGTGGKL